MPYWYYSPIFFGLKDRCPGRLTTVIRIPYYNFCVPRWIFWKLLTKSIPSSIFQAALWKWKIHTCITTVSTTVDKLAVNGLYNGGICPIKWATWGRASQLHKLINSHVFHHHQSIQMGSLSLMTRRGNVISIFMSTTLWCHFVQGLQLTALCYKKVVQFLTKTTPNMLDSSCHLLT